MDERVGFTTTIPVEIIFAAGLKPCDLNNVFISDDNPGRYLGRAEKDGFPKGICNWIKGIYGVVMEEGVGRVITVMEGDCSSTQGLAEILTHRGVSIIPFSFPFDRDRNVLGREIEKLKAAFGVGDDSLARAEAPLERVRKGLTVIDDMTWRDNVVSGFENHLWLVQASDMRGDCGRYGDMVEDFIIEARQRAPMPGIRLGYIGVPPIIPDLYHFVEGLGARVVYNETQRQFSLPFFGGDIVERYGSYTYPYGVFARLEDIKAEIKRRRIEGVIHYVQAFCFRVMEDVIIRELLDVPVLTIEGELPKVLDTRTKLRIEAFVEMLRGLGHGEE